jgi:hypothetical protein
MIAVQQIPADFGLLTADAESMDLEVLQGLDFSLSSADHHHRGLFAKVSCRIRIAQEERLPASNPDCRKFNLDFK